MEEMKKKGLNRFNSSPQNETLHALNVYQNVIDSVVIKERWLVFREEEKYVLLEFRTQLFQNTLKNRTRTCFVQG